MNKFYVLFTLFILGSNAILGQLSDPGRGMYVNRFFRLSANQTGGVIIDPNNSILSIQAKEDSLLSYARDNHITYLILYDLHRIFGSALYESYLCSFIEKAKTEYCIEKIGAASSCEAMFDNVATITGTEPYTFISPSYSPSLGFVQNYYPPGDPMFYLAEVTKLGIRATTFNDDCAYKIDIFVTEYEFWNSGTDNCTDQAQTKDQKYQNFQSMIGYMDEIRDSYNANHSHQLYVETYLGYLNQNTAYTHQNIANWIDGSYNGKRRVDRILLHYYSANPVNLYSRTSSGTNYNGYYLTRFVDFAQSTTNANSNVLPIFSTEHVAWGAGSNFFGAWFNLSVNNNIFTAEKIWFNDWYADANTHSPSLIGNPTHGNVINPGGAIWFTSNYMVNHLERPVMFTSNSPVCVQSGQNGALHFQYQGPIEQGIGFRFYITDAGDTTVRCGSKYLHSWPLYDGVTQTSIDLDTALNGCELPVGNYDAHLELQFSSTCSIYVAPVRSVSVVTNGQIVALTPTTTCNGNAVYLQASSTGGGTSTYQWFKGNQSVSGATSATYAPTTTGTANYSCRITSSNGSCSANRSSPISVSINTYPSAAISVQSSTDCERILKANPTGAGYLWPDGSTGSTYSAVRGGNYSVAVTSNGCQAVASYSFTNVTMSQVEFNAECAGSYNGSLKVKISSGTSPYRLTWNGLVSGADSGLLSGNYLVSGLASGNYSIIVTDANGCTASIQSFVPLAALPVVTIAGNSPLCTGQTLQLSASGGVMYEWSGPEAFTSGSSSPSLTNVSLLHAGVYTVVVTNLNGCTGSASIAVSVSDAFIPTALGDTICLGETLSLTSDGGNTYVWQGPSSFFSTLQNPVIDSATAANSGVYFVTVTDASGCVATTSVSAVVNVLPVLNVSNDGPSCEGHQMQLFATGGSQYLWSGPGAFTSNVQDPVLMNLSFADTGFYHVIVTDTNQCSANDSTEVVIRPLTTYYYDGDGDGFGIDVSQQYCNVTGNFSALVSGDCDDNNASVSPLAIEVCYNGLDENCNGMGDDSCANVLHVKLFVEGYYRGNNEMCAVLNPFIYPTLCDSFTVNLHSVHSPFTLLYTSTDTLDIFGNGFFHFPNPVVGEEFYISIKHRNTLETWSKNSVLFQGSHVNYNFTLNSNRAFGSNMKALGDGSFAVFSGDINQDGVIDSFDFTLLSTSISDFTNGYYSSDLTGDNFVEAADCSLLENNLGKGVMRP